MIKRPRGTNDFLPEMTEKWQYIEQVLRDLCDKYGYEEIRFPIFEHTELFQRGVGDTTDIVEKEMYTFVDKGDRSLTLRPEGTASAVRCFIENKLYGKNMPQKLYYMGPMFRYERPQAGRFRQFHQFGIEVFGSMDASVDAEIIEFAVNFYQKLGIKKISVNLNSVGCPQCRQSHKAALQKFLENDLEELCADCRNRYERNPLRILDCKKEKCQKITQGAPTTLACLCDDCRQHFEEVKAYLKAAGIPFEINERLVRGLDYYTKTAFEILVEDIGAQSAVCGGGRYDGLVEMLDGPKEMPGVGFALGMERIFATLASQDIELGIENKADVYMVSSGSEAAKVAFKLLTELRHAGIKAKKDDMARSLKAQMKAANREKARYVIIIGSEELTKGEVLLKDMTDSDQISVKTEEIIEIVKKRLQSK